MRHGALGGFQLERFVRVGEANASASAASDTPQIAAVRGCRPYPLSPTPSHQGFAVN
jgi:hypothetical protein